MRLRSAGKSILEDGALGVHLAGNVTLPRRTDRGHVWGQPLTVN
jgi:hypothetical protein